MPSYTAPIKDYQFLLNELLETGSYTAVPGFENAGEELINTIVEEAGKFMTEVFAPCNQAGDEHGAWLENGNVISSPGFKEAYAQYVEAGWGSLSCDPAYNGQGLPHMLGFMLEEMMTSANMALGLCPLLARGAYQAVYEHGSDEQKQRYLPRLVSGEWSVAMSLTEPHAGTDLGLIRTRATADTDGSYRIAGTKIFITWGDHDMTENILHLVLARLPDSPAGTKGISLFLVPKFLMDADGSCSTRNAFSCGSLEHKMGIHGSPTCVMNYDNATGYLIGGINQGMQAMFVMMNAARLGVGIQGVSQAEVSFQNALVYCRDRLQGRAATGPKYPDKAADPLIVHADVRRMLMTMKAFIEGGRAFALWVGLHIDFAERHPDPEQRRISDGLVSLLTPVIKAYLSDKGFDCVNLGLQCFGGHGYIREWGMEQFVRDCRITQLYEGTNGIQALDLTGRKVLRDGGATLRIYIRSISDFIGEKAGTPGLEKHLQRLQAGIDILEKSSKQLLTSSQQNPDETGAAAVDYLHLLGLLSLGFMWVRIADVSLQKLEATPDDPVFYRNKLKTADFFFERIFPDIHALKEKILAGSASVMAIADEQF